MTKSKFGNVQISKLFSKIFYVSELRSIIWVECNLRKCKFPIWPLKMTKSKFHNVQIPNLASEIFYVF